MTRADQLKLPASAGTAPAILAFIGLAFVFSWGAGLAGAMIRPDLPLLGAALLTLAGFGPSLAGAATVGVFGGRGALREWIGRCINRRVSWRWLFAAFVVPPALMVCALGVHMALGAEWPSFPAVHHITLAIANFGLVLLVGGPLGEEFGWRGYLTPALTRRMNWRMASLLIGIVWGVWHLPLFVLAGTVQSQMAIPVFLVNVLAGAVLFGWLFERSGGSLLPALVLHTSLNAWAGLLAIVPTAETQRPYLLVTGLLVLVASALLLTPDRKRARDVHRFG